MLNKELAIRVIYQPKYGRSFVVGFRDGEDSIKKLRNRFPTEEESMSAYVDYDPVGANLGLTPSKRSAYESLYDMENVQLSSTKMFKDVKKEKWSFNDEDSSDDYSSEEMGEYQNIDNYSDSSSVINDDEVYDSEFIIDGFENIGDKRDIILERHSGRLKRISEFRPSYMAYQYPLLFPRGEYGFRKGVLHRETNGKKSKFDGTTMHINVEEVKQYLDCRYRRWRPCKRGHTIGRLIWVPPSSGELYYLRMMITVVRGPTCYNDIKYVRGKVQDSFRDASFEM
ncbi:hypothetical protein KIW84_013673 [Lathyrus oleraceus]|uniref:Uncharacterized protein n=1 Tax=Pisum sativum TaxID=3888 RepID=A0A9D5BKQ8_PEA|nr:hypothetical protein KIW84_013673 [Pisum sativum]